MTNSGPERPSSVFLGPYESDYDVESSEVREALTDFESVGQEKMGDYMVSLFPPKSICGIFVEDNQATIRILENGKSPSFRQDPVDQLVMVIRTVQEGMV